MSLLEIDRSTSAPPDLPPILKPKGPRKGRFIILPDIIRAHDVTRTQNDNTWTIHYFWMTRWWDDGRMEFAHVNTREYRRWLETYEMKDGIPPHISFGGAVVSGEPDPEFYNRWVSYAQKTFC